MSKQLSALLLLLIEEEVEADDHDGRDRFIDEEDDSGHVDRRLDVIIGRW
jgi:hypothetical protein